MQHQSRQTSLPGHLDPAAQRQIVACYRSYQMTWVILICLARAQMVTRSTGIERLACSRPSYQLSYLLALFLALSTLLSSVAEMFVVS